MDRMIYERSILDKFCEDFCSVVEKHCRYIIVSGFLVIASGRIRGTEDIDMIIERMDLPAWSALFNELRERGFSCIQSDDPKVVYEYLQDNTSIRFQPKDRPTPEMEIKFAKDLLDQYQLQSRLKLPLTGLDVWFSNININIAFKEELLKSPKDMEDARFLRIIYKEMVDENEIKTVKQMIRKLRL